MSQPHEPDAPPGGGTATEQLPVGTGDAAGSGRTTELPRSASAAPPPPGPLDGHDGPGLPDAPHVQPPADDRPRRHERRRAGAVGAGVAGLSLLLGLGGGAAGAVLIDRLGDQDTTAPVVGSSGDGPVTAPGASTDDGQAAVREPGSIAGVAARVLPSVVSVEVRGAQGAGTGSGFVIDADGLLLTNNHVVAGALDENGRLVGDISVVFVDGSTAEAELVGRTRRYDMAVLRVDRTGLPPLTFEDDEVVVGDPVVAVGAPLGLQSTVTSGIVSALDRPVSAGSAGDASFMNAVQTDAAINPGNSGGPLVDLEGKVVGINSAIAQAPGAGGAGGNIGLGFAIPAEQAVRTSQEIIDTGVATYPVIGVSLDGQYTGEGVQVTTQTGGEAPPITPGSPAARAGIEPGDVILAFEGRPVTQDAELIVAIGAQRPGDTVTLTVERDGERRDVDLVLDEAEED